MVCYDSFKKEKWRSTLSVHVVGWVCGGGGGGDGDGCGGVVVFVVF